MPPLRRALGVAVLALVLCALAPAVASAATFQQRFSKNDSGDITLVANTLMTCPSTQTNASNISCGAAKSATSGGAGLADNDFDMQYVDTDGDPTTFDSSSARLALPQGATVLFAGLYWGARTSAGTNGTAARSAAAKNKVKLRVPGGSYEEYAADLAWTIDGDAYQQYENVTAAVKAAGSGVYTVADVQAGTGQDRYAGWSLVVAYEDLNAAPHNLSVFDGLTVVSQSTPTADIDVSGFTTAPSGDVNTTLGAIAYEGDMGKTGDGMTLAGRAIGDAASPSTDLFNSSVAVLGTRTMTGRDPAQQNHLGFDADLFDADRYLTNSATSARLTVNTAQTNGETIYPGVLTFSSELLAAKLRPATTVTDENGGNAEPGDVLRYETEAVNTGNGAAGRLKLESDLPPGVELVTDSLELVDAGGAGTAQTAQGGDDAVAYDPATRAITWNLGTGATPTAGGSLPVGGRVRVRYRVRVGAPRDGATLPAATTVFYRTEGTTDDYVVPATGGAISASTPDLAMDLTRTGEIVRGGRLDYTLAVSNSGSAPAKGLTRVTDQLPSTLVADGTPTGTGWDCAVSAGLVTCDRTDALAPSASYPAIHVPVRVAQDASGAVVNAATATNAGDGDHTNDSDGDDGGLAAVRATLSLGLSRDPAAISPGETATVTATVTNTGPSDAAGVQVAMPLPAGLELVSAHAGGQDCVATTCAVGTVPAGGTGTAVYVVRAKRAAAGSDQALVATSTSATADATANDDSANATVAVRELRLVSVTQDVAPATLVAGAPATIDLAVRNDGPTTATGVVLEEPLPAELHDAEATIDAADGSCAITAGVLRCTLAPLADGDSVPVTVHARVAADGAGAALDLRAAVAAVAGDPDQTDDAVLVQRTVAGSADVSLTSVGAPATVRAGERGTWVLRVENDGPGDATGTVLTFPLPDGTHLAGDDGASCTVVAAVVTCALGRLAPGDHRDVSITLAASPGAAAGARAIAASAGADEPDPDGAGDARLDLAATVVREADLAVSQTGPDAVVAGTAAAYRTTVTNAGPADATGVAVTLAVPAGLTGATASVRDGRGTCTVAGATITCRIGALAVGGRVVIELSGAGARNAGGTSFDVVARATAAEADADTTDNRAARTTAASAVSDVSVAAFAPAGTVAAGATAQVTLTAHNDGPSDAEGVVLATTLPAAAQAIDLDPRCTLAGRTVTCRMGTVAAGADRPIVITVRALRAFPGALLGAGATISTTARDPQPANDNLAALAEEPVRCTSRRKFTIRLRVPAAAKLKSVTVKVAGKPVRVSVGRRLTAVVDLRTRPAGRILVQIRAVTRAGRPIVGTRAYQTCTVKRPTVRPPRV